MALTLAERLVRKAYRAELHRRPAAEELAPLLQRARTMIHHDRDDRFIVKRLSRALDASPEGQAIDQAYGAAKALLGHAPDAALLQQARELAAQGKPAEEIRAALEVSIKAGSEYRLDHAGEVVGSEYLLALGRAPSRDERLDGALFTRQLISEGKSPDDVHAAWAAKLGATTEGRRHAAPNNVRAVYAFTMGREPSPEELDRDTGLVRKLIDEGKSNDEVNGVLDSLLKLGPEWQAKHPQMNHDRDAIYMHQPNGWTCGPTSLAMAMAAAGKRPLNEDTVWEMAGPDKLNTIANQSTDKMPWEIADVVRSMGVNAEPHVLAQPPEIREALERGHGVVVNGKHPDTSGHFIYLAGLDEQGQIIVCDPWKPEITRWSDEQLGAFTYGRGNSVEIWP